ncbi:hypothetical protein [Brevibacillus formosus]
MGFYFGGKILAGSKRSSGSVLTLVGGLLGCYFGNLLMKKHVKKAKLV